MDLEQRYKAAKKIHALAREYRGSLLNSAACIEAELSDLIGEYFCPDPDRRARLDAHVIQTGMFTLDRKLQILKTIVREDYPRRWAEDAEIWQRFARVTKLRNGLAHSRVDTSAEALARPLTEGIGFEKYENGKPITAGRFNEFEVDACMILSYLREMHVLIPYKEHPLQDP